MPDRGAHRSGALPSSAETPQSAGPDGVACGAGRRWRRHLAAIGLGLLVLVAAETVCRLAGWGDPLLREDPFVGFAGNRPLFVLDDAATRYIIPRVREEFFARDSFPVTKPPGQRRVFCLGGSTVQGRPYSIATAFSAWLELALNRIDADHSWDVVNCGGISYASYRLVPILEECLQYEPDLIILCTGHNEFLEDRTYRDVSRSTILHRTSSLRLVNVARSAIDKVAAPDSSPVLQDERTILPLETEPILNFNGGLAVYQRDDSWRSGVIAHYEVNVRRMVQMCRAAGVPLLLLLPSSNLQDCPPFKSQHRRGLSAGERAMWDDVIAQARQASHHDDVSAVRLFERALEIDLDHALTHFELGQAHRRLLDHDAARRSFIRARDLDICPLRMVSELEDHLRHLAADEDVPLLDLHRLLEERCLDGILGDDQLVDHIHPSIEGHQLIANALVEQLSEAGFVTLPDGWELSAKAVYEEHLATLESAYFLRGQRMLDGLRAWTQGRADGPPAAERFPGRVDR